MSTPTRIDDTAVHSIERPDRRLWTYYLFTSFLAGPGFPVLMLYQYFRYHTMRYRFDDEGISMRWGVLFRREINLTYARIQDIHLSSNILERWLGLARIQVQTASGNAGAEMTIEGVLEFEKLRDYLYSKMRGTTGLEIGDRVKATDDGDADGLASVLRDVAEEIRGLRKDLARRRTDSSNG
ncbi:MAG: PH domain-containing protein [Acidobacteria bacterium]|nr:PH domain-containing protein [Acidobacteriota bacterium]